MLNCLKSIFSKEKQKTVLVIDDSATDRAFAEKILEKKYSVVCARSGQDGLLAAKEIRPDAIVLDFMMPGLKGPEVCKLLRGDEATSRIPVIFLTSMDTPSHLIESFEQEADAFLTKPVKGSDLIRQVETSLRPPVFN